MLADGSVVGQLRGICPAVSDSCTQQHDQFDGAFALTYPAIAQWLTPAGGGPQPCTTNSNTLCLSSGRFRVQTAWRSSTGSGQGTADSLTPNTGYFWFFDSTNVEVVIKVLDACSFSPYKWVYASGLTDVEVTLTVTDTKTGIQKTYFNPLGTTFVTVTDTAAFHTCP